VRHLLSAETECHVVLCEIRHQRLAVETQEAEQQVLPSNFGVIQVVRFFGRASQRSLRAAGKRAFRRERTRRPYWFRPEQVLDFVADVFGRQPAEELRDEPTFSHDAKQQMLWQNREVVVRYDPREKQSAPGLLSVPVEHLITHCGPS
jgi:hypothetical protein